MNTISNCTVKRVICVQTSFILSTIYRHSMCAWGETYLTPGTIKGLKNKQFTEGLNHEEYWSINNGAKTYQFQSWNPDRWKVEIVFM